MLDHYKCDTEEHISKKFEPKYTNYYRRKWIWNVSKWRPFCLGLNVLMSAYSVTGPRRINERTTQADVTYYSILKAWMWCDGMSGPFLAIWYHTPSGIMEETDTGIVIKVLLLYISCYWFYSSPVQKQNYYLWICVYWRRLDGYAFASQTIRVTSGEKSKSSKFNKMIKCI